MNKQRRKELCSILGVSIESSEQEIKKCYIKLAMAHHPDNNPDNQEEATKKFQEISNAYEILTGVLNYNT
jgi:DnaJ-class molecular chaperone